MFPTFKIIWLVSLIHVMQCSIDGISYINDRNKVEEQKYNKGEDPCNPLYWYPRMRPEYCDQKVIEPPRQNLIPLPVPMPAPPPPPAPVPIGIPIAPSDPFIPVAGIPIAMPPPFPPQMYMPPSFAMPPQPCVLPLTSPMACPMPQAAFPMPPPAYPMQFPQAYGYGPYPQYPMPYPVFPPPQPMIGLVPGINGMVSKDGAINIMPMSDVYADVLEKHKQRVVRKRLENLLGEYDGRRQEGRRSQQRAESRRHQPRPAQILSE